jgi:endonuclease YncB( thermonuclease family)
MTLLRRVLGKKAYTLLLAVLLFATLLYQRETGILPTWNKPTETQEKTTESVTDQFLVVRVIDGDTFEIEGGERVRLIGVDTPESVKPNAPVECFARESSEYLKNLIEGKTVRLVRDKTDRDRYARLLRYAYLGEVFINEQIIREGYGEAIAYRPDTRQQVVLDVAESEAQREKKGLFSDTTCR